MRNRTTPGERLLGIRWADAATGGPALLSGMFTRALLSDALRRAIAWINRPAIDRELERNQETVRRIEEVRAKFGKEPGDREEMERASAELSDGTASSCGRAVPGPVAMSLAEPLTAFLSSHRQSLIERAAGVVVVRDRG